MLKPQFHKYSEIGETIIPGFFSYEIIFRIFTFDLKKRRNYNLQQTTDNRLLISSLINT